MDSQAILIGIIVGLIVGTGVGYLMAPSTDVSKRARVFCSSNEDKY